MSALDDEWELVYRAAAGDEEALKELRRSVIAEYTKDVVEECYLTSKTNTFLNRIKRLTNPHKE
jgi:hypothetical protein